MPTRRRFLSQAATVFGGALAFRVHADDKSGTRPVVIGSGAHRYECDHEWGTLPSNIKWQTTHGVAVDAAGLIYITHQGYGQEVMDTVVVFDPKGNYVHSFGKKMHGGGHGIDIRAEAGQEVIYLADFAHGYVEKNTLKGEPLGRKDKPTEPAVYKDKMTFKPTNVAFGPDGDWFMADGYGSNFIHHFDHTNRWLNTFGGTGSETGQLKTPHGLWWDNRPGRPASLVVADRANARLCWFGRDGKPGPIVKDVLYPAHFDIRGEVLLVPDLHARVSLFDRQNQPIVHLGYDADWTATVKDPKKAIRNDPKLWPAGKFVHPHDACFDADGNIFVVEWVRTGRVTKLRKVS